MISENMGIHFCRRDSALFRPQKWIPSVPFIETSIILCYTNCVALVVLHEHRCIEGE